MSIGWLEKMFGQRQAMIGDITGMMNVGVAGALNSVTPSATATVAPPKRPTAAKVDATATAVLEEYEATAKKVGFAPGCLIDERIKAALAGEGLPIYDFTMVDEWLRYKLKGSGTVWYWRPLRKKDALKFSWGLGGYGSYAHGCYSKEGEPYDKLVPLAALKTVARVEALMEDDEVAFLVSDCRDPDPFMAVTSKKRKGLVFIIEAWDEPGFGV